MGRPRGTTQGVDRGHREGCTWLGGGQGRRCPCSRGKVLCPPRGPELPRQQQETGETESTGSRLLPTPSRPSRRRHRPRSRPGGSAELPQRFPEGILGVQVVLSPRCHLCPPLPGRQTGSSQRAGAQAQGPHQGQLPQPAGFRALAPRREGEFMERAGSTGSTHLWSRLLGLGRSRGSLVPRESLSEDRSQGGMRRVKFQVSPLN